MSDSTRTPVNLPVPPQPQRPLQVALTGFGVIVASALGQAVKEAGFSGAARAVVDVASRGWYVGAALVALALAWIAWLLVQSLRQQAADFREHAMRTDDNFAASLRQHGELLQQRIEMQRQQGVILDALRDQVTALPEVIARVVAEVTNPQARRPEVDE